MYCVSIPLGSIYRITGYEYIGKDEVSIPLGSIYSWVEENLPLLEI